MCGQLKLSHANKLKQMDNAEEDVVWTHPLCCTEGSCYGLKFPYFLSEESRKTIMHEFSHKVADFQRYFDLPNDFPNSILDMSLPGLVLGRGVGIFKK